MENVKVFCLLNGREIVATIKEETDSHYICSNAIAVALVEQGQGQIGINPHPVSFLAIRDEHGINVNISKVALAYEPFEPNTDIVAMYAQIKSPIQLVTAPVKGQFTRN